MRSVVIDEVAIATIFHDPRGPLARVLEDFANTVVVPDSKEALSVPWGGRGTTNPTNIPRRRTGDLRDSVRALPANIDDGGLHVAVVADPEHNGQAYAQWLRNGGQAGKEYRFLPDRPIYIWVNVP